MTAAVTQSSSLWCRKYKAFCQCSYALHCQQPEKDKHIVDIAIPGKISADAHGHCVTEDLWKDQRAYLVKQPIIKLIEKCFCSYCAAMAGAGPSVFQPVL